MDRIVLLCQYAFQPIGSIFAAIFNKKILPYFYFWKKSKKLIKKEYLVPLYQNSKTKVFNFTDKNLLSITLPENKKNIIKNNNNYNDYQVELNFTLDGLLGFGSELIRQALEIKQEGDNPNFEPKKTEPYFYRGVHLTEKSPELVPLVNEDLEFNEQEKKEYESKKIKSDHVFQIMDFLDQLRFHEQESKKIMNASYIYQDIKNKTEQKNKENNCYLVDLIPDAKKIESFEIAKNNLVKVTLKHLIDTSVIDNITIPHIYLHFTSDGMLRFGEELIRLAMAIPLQQLGKATSFKTQHLTANDLGLSLTSNSASLLITVNHSKVMTTPISKATRKKIIWQNNGRLNVVLNIFPTQLIIKCDSEHKRTIGNFYSPVFWNKLYLFKKIWSLTYSSNRIEIEDIIQDLRNKNFMFCKENFKFTYQYTPWYTRVPIQGTFLTLKWVNKDEVIIQRDYLRIGYTTNYPQLIK